MTSPPPHLDRPTPELSSWFEPPDPEAWRAAADKALRGRPFDTLVRTVAEGIELPPMHLPDDPGPGPGWPDTTPFTRGAGDRLDGWDVRAWIDAGPAEAVHTAVTEALAVEATSLWLVPDGAGRALGVAAPGAGLHGLDDLARALEGVTLSAMPVHVEAGSAGTAWFAALHHLAEAQGTTPSGGLHVDPLGDLAQHGVLPAGLDAAYAEVARLIRWARSHAPGLTIATLSTEPPARAGGHEVHQLGWLLASAVELLRRLESHGLTPEEVVPHLSLRVVVGRDTFVEIAKVRALRTAWSKLLAACGVEAALQRPVVHAVAHPGQRSRIDPWVNLLRSTHTAFVGAVAGADAVSLMPFDRPLGAPDALGRRMALTTQQVLAREAHLARVVDPAGGARTLEHLTDALARGAWGLMQQVDADGGLAALLQGGHLHGAFEAAEAAKRRGVDTRRRAWVGTNTWPDLSADPVQRPPVAAVGGDEVSPADVDVTDLDGVRSVVQEGATVAAVAAAREGEATTVQPLPSLSETAPWEGLRDASEAHRARTGRRPTVFLATLGPLARHKPRADFAARLFEAGGFEVIAHEGTTFLPDLVEAFGDHGADGACICGVDEDYAEFVPHLAPRLADEGAAFVTVAGRPGDHAAAWRKAGITDPIFAGCEALTLLTRFQAAVGVSR